MASFLNSNFNPVPRFFSECRLGFESSHYQQQPRTEGIDLSLRQPDVTAVLLWPGRQTKLIKVGEGRCEGGRRWRIFTGYMGVL